MSTRNINNPPNGDFFRRNGALLQIGLVKPTATPSMKVQINPILIPCFGSEWIDFVGGLSPEMTPPPATYAKWNLVGLNSYGAPQLIDGDPAANNPQFPIPPKNFLPLAAIFIEADDTEVTDDMVFDIRPFLSLGGFPVDHSELTGASAENLHEIASIRNLITELGKRVLHTELTDILKSKADLAGTPSTEFTLNTDETGVPATTCTFKVKRGDQLTVGFRWNEQLDRWQYTNDGSEWIDFSNTGYITAANQLNLGTVFLSVNPVDPEHPIAVGDNDPRLQPSTDTSFGIVQLSTSDPSGKVVADNDPRNSDSRNPLAHANSHISGTDDIPLATQMSKGLMSESQVQRLSEISDDRLFNDLTQKASVMTHLEDQDDPHGSRSSHENEYEHRLLYWNTLSEYVVGNNPERDKFTTIQSAIDAVVANSANINGNKVVIFVKPGIYTGNITLQPNIILSTLTGKRNHTTTINGTITMDFQVDGCHAGINGFSITSGLNPAVIFTGSNKQTLHFYNNSIYTSGGVNSFKADNTNIQSAIYAKDCSCNFDNAGTGAAFLIAGSNTVELTDCGITKANGVALACSESSKVFVYLTELTGTFTVANTSSLQLSLSAVTSLNGINNVNSTAPTILVSSLINSTLSDAVQGTGMFLFTNVGFTGSSVKFAETLNGNNGAQEIPSTGNSVYTKYNPSNAAPWAVSPPTNVRDALDRLAVAFHSHLQIPIP